MLLSVVEKKKLNFHCQRVVFRLDSHPNHPPLPLFSFPSSLYPLASSPPLPQRRWWPGWTWCRDRYLTLRWRRAPFPVWAHWRASRPPRSPINSSWLTSASWAPCCLRCTSWAGWGNGRWPSRQRWEGREKRKQSVWNVNVMGVLANQVRLYRFIIKSHFCLSPKYGHKNRRHGSSQSVKLMASNQ